MTNKLKDPKNKHYNNDLRTRGWPPARRRAQAERLKRTRIWEKSTGPKTKTGKQAISNNAYKHGNRCREVRAFCLVLRQQRQFIRILEVTTLRRPYRQRRKIRCATNNAGKQPEIEALRLHSPFKAFMI